MGEIRNLFCPSLFSFVASSPPWFGFGLINHPMECQSFIYIASPIQIKMAPQAWCPNLTNQLVTFVLINWAYGAICIDENKLRIKNFIECNVRFGLTSL